MSKWLTSSAGTGKKIIENKEMFTWLLADNEDKNETMEYSFSWRFNKQFGHGLIKLRSGKIDESSMIFTDENSPKPFCKTLCLYNDPTLMSLFEIIIQKD